jgi:AraC family transcriptional activator of mtrCDE
LRTLSKGNAVTIPAHDLDGLFRALDVDFVQLAECLVSPGWGLTLEPDIVPGLHYVLLGTGKLSVENGPTIDLAQHTLVVLPPKSRFTLHARHITDSEATNRIVDSRHQPSPPGALRRLVAGSGEPDLIVICGYFRATYAASIDLFAALPAPIVEKFTAADQLDQVLTSALSELIAQEAGAGAMSTALLKQVLVTILRRSLNCARNWVERFSILKDPKIARAFAAMVTRPGAAHTIRSLARTSELSRSSFMSRFVELFGDSPMNILRKLRMHQANILLKTRTHSVEQVANLVGYSSRTSFSRVYRRVYGQDPDPKS